VEPAAARDGGGFTLLELLLAIAIVLAVGALVVPAVSSRARQQAFESGAELVRNQLLLARLHARATGRLVEVVFLDAPPRMEARFYEPSVAAEDDDDDEGGPRRAGRDETRPYSDSAPRPDLLITTGWARRALPEGLWIEVEPGPADEPDVPVPGRWSTGRTLPAGLAAPEAEPLRLALYLPDGSALEGEPLRLADRDGRGARFSINPWTGLPAFETGEPPPDTEAQADETGADEAGDAGPVRPSSPDEPGGWGQSREP
jgi:type II secretory pathway pseudopilin PulG